MPNGTERLSEISDLTIILNLVRLKTRTVEYVVSNGKSIFSLDGKEFTEEEVKTFNLTKHELNSCKLLYLYIFYPWNEPEPLLIQW
jgi:hypothetical protein